MKNRWCDKFSFEANGRSSDCCAAVLWCILVLSLRLCHDVNRQRTQLAVHIATVASLRSLRDYFLFGGQRSLFSAFPEAMCQRAKLEPWASAGRRWKFFCRSFWPRLHNAVSPLVLQTSPFLFTPGKSGMPARPPLASSLGHIVAFLWVARNHRSEACLQIGICFPVVLF